MIRSLLMLMLLSSPCCSPASNLGDNARSAAVDCTTSQIGRVIGEFSGPVSQAIASARDGSGHVDWTAVKASVTSLGKDVGACVLADVIAGYASGKRSLSGVTIAPEEARRGFGLVRDSLWPGVSYKTSAGVL